MTDSMNVMAQLCRQRCETVMASYAFGQLDLDRFAEIQAKKVRHNTEAGCLRDPSDAVKAAVDLTEGILGKADGDRLREALKMKVICTADHHGSLYCSQFLQGNVLFALMMEKLGSRNMHVPIFAAGQVELENSTYSRGICAYASRHQKQLLRSRRHSSEGNHL